MSPSIFARIQMVGFVNLYWIKIDQSRQTDHFVPRVKLNLMWQHDSAFHPLYLVSQPCLLCSV